MPWLHCEANKRGSQEFWAQAICDWELAIRAGSRANWSHRRIVSYRTLANNELEVLNRSSGADRMSFHVGQTFGDYSITALLGAGGIGQVYRVEHSLTNRTETMKVLAELASENSIKRFEREMRALAKLSHPNIAALHNALQSENQLILLMEYIEGQTLESMFHAGRLPLETGVGYIKQMLSALGYAHQQGVVHRDVTPA